MSGLGNCRLCRFWDSMDGREGNYGLCLLLSDTPLGQEPESPARLSYPECAVDMHHLCRIYTRFNFGCNHFQSREARP